MEEHEKIGVRGFKLFYVIGFMLVLTSTCTDSRELISGTDITVLRGSTLIDSRGGAPLPNSVIAIKGKRIFRVGRAGDFRIDDDVNVEDVTGRFITPGFVDVHVHPRVGAEDATMRMLLAFGITTIRIPGVGFESPDNLGLQLREKIARGEQEGPRVFTGGKIIEGPRKTFPGDVEVRSAEDMRREVRRQAEEGVDLVKLYWQTPSEFIQAAVEEAHTHGIQVIGHLRATSWTRAATAGIDGLVHSGVDGPCWELVPHDSLMAIRSLSTRKYLERLADLIDLKSPQFDSLVSSLVEHNVTVDPTLITMQTLYYGDDLDVLKLLEPDITPRSVQSTWGEGWQKANPILKLNEETKDYPYGKHLFERAKEITGEFYQRGVHLAVGSDVGMPWITPGVSFHREMQLLKETGIPPGDVLVLATRNGAEALRSSDKFGTIAPGLSADLVILRADPTIDIKNSRSIDAVFKGGERFEPENLLSNLR